MAKQQIFERKAPEQDFLAKLEELLKKNKGTGLYEAYDVNPRAFRLPGRVSDPSGLGQDRMNDSVKFAPYDYSTIPFDAPNLGQVPQYQYQDFEMPDFPMEFERWNPQQGFNDPNYQEALQTPIKLSTDEMEKIYQDTGKSYGIASLSDGGVLFNDNFIRYDDGTIREYTGQYAQPIASMQDGSTRYSDGSFRRPASPEEMQVQSVEPVYPIASNADGTVLYSDGISRTYNPTVGKFQNIDSGVLNFFNTFNQGYRFRPRGQNDLTGQCAWFSQQITTLPDGSSWRVGDTLEQKMAYLQNYIAGGLAFTPDQGTAKAGNSIVFDEGTRYGHVATVSEVFMGGDGQLYYRLTESNYAAPNTVTHDRIVRANDPKILGVIKTQARQGYNKVDWNEAPQITGERNLAVQENAAQGLQERPGGDAPEDMMVQEAPMSMMPEQQSQPQQMQPQYNREAPIIAQAGANLIDRANLTGDFDLGISEMLRGDREGAQQAREATVQKYSPIEAELGFSEGLLTPEAQQARISALSQQPKTPYEERNLFGKVRQLAGNVTERVGDTLGIPEGSFSETIAGGATKRTNQAMADEIGGERPEQVPGIRQNIQDIGQDINQKVVQPVVAKAGEGIDFLKEKASNIFQKTPLMGLFGGQKQVGDAKGATLFEGGQTQSRAPQADAFFKYGGADQYADYLVNNAREKQGGALSTSLFTPEFYQDPNRVANVFGETSQGRDATGLYKSYLQSQIRPEFTQPYRTERRQEGDTTYEYKIPIQEYFQNQYYNKLMSDTPDVLKSGFSFDQFQTPTVSRSASEYKGEVPTKTGREPIFKSGAVDLFKRWATQPGQLAPQYLKEPAPVYQSSIKSSNFAIPEASRSVFQAPSVESIQMPQTTRKAISKPSLQDYLNKGKTVSQWFAEVGGQDKLDALQRKGYDPRSNRIPDEYKNIQKTISDTNKIASSVSPEVAQRISEGMAKQRAEDEAAIKSGVGLRSLAPSVQSQPSAQLSSSVKPGTSVFSSVSDWIKRLFNR